MADIGQSARRILVIEDDADQREIFSALLYYNGYDVVEAGSMADAYEFLASDKPDAILLDVVLPDANGLEAAAALRSAEATAAIPVVCMTAYDVHLNRATSAGCVALLRKPLNGADLVRALQLAFKSQGLRAG